MGVFLRWGVFGILAVAALVYAYNALGHIADARKQAASAAPVTQTESAPNVVTATTAPVADAAPAKPVDDTPERCRVEIDIARRASESRSIGEPLDRLLRIQEIAWQEDAKRRERLTAIATDWFNRPGSIDAATQRAQVLRACLDFKP